MLDYFPNAVRYAAAALYYQGVCHQANGAPDKARTKWAEMARDADYSKHVLAAPALIALADFLAADGQGDKAVEYYEKVVLNFRGSNRAAAARAIGRIVEHYVRTQPNEPKLREAYAKFRGFGDKPGSVAADLTKAPEYWNLVRELVKRHGRFEKWQEAEQARHYRYWAQALEGRFPKDDDFQIDVANFHRIHEKQTNKWMERLDKLFVDNRKKGDYGRIVKWIRLYGAHRAKALEYYRKIDDLSKMSNGEIRALVCVLFDNLGDAAMARNAFGKLRLGEMPDAEKVSLAEYLWKRDGKLVVDVCVMMSDKVLGRFQLLRYYHFAKDLKNGLPLADGLASDPKYAKDALWLKAELLEANKKYQEAIGVYQQVDDQPANLWRVAGCYAAMGKLAPAEAQLGEIERFFRDESAKAALGIAMLRKRFKLDKQIVAEAFWRVMKKYPGSPQSRAAHVELEHMGYKPGGGKDAD